MAVVTGQQVGLFSGPAYTIHKALTAVKLAERLSSEGLPTVPIFWLASEDHDFAEVDHAWTFNGTYDPVALRASTKTNFGQRPVGTIALDDIPIDELRTSLQSFPFADEVVARVEAAYRPGSKMGEAFRDLLKSLLARFNILYLDPQAEDIHRLRAPLLARAALMGTDLKQRLEQRNREIIEAGYHTQVHVEAQTSLLFLLEGGRRIGLKFQNGEYASARDGKFTAEELAARAENLSPNALLRPVMQDYLLPTVTYVGGPSELAYLAQSQVLYEQLLGRMPVVMHRAGFTLLDARAKKLLERYELPWSVVYEGESGIREAIACKLVPPAVKQAFEKNGRDVKRSLDELGTALSGFDPTLVAALAKSRAKVEYQLAKMEKKVAREALKRDERAATEAHFLAGLLYPQKHLQERFYTILPFLAKHGFELIDTLYENVQLDCPDHQIVVV
jgi:bacillithiol synthase